MPAFENSGLLPEGIHWTDMQTVQKRYCQSAHRERLFAGFERAVAVLRQAGCLMLYLDGSFVTAKEHRADYDACWEPKGVNLSVLDPVFFDFRNKRAAQKAIYFGEFFPADSRAEARSPFRTFLNFFQTDKDAGERKGIIGIKMT